VWLKVEEKRQGMTQGTIKYIYSMSMCSACEALKEKYREGHIAFQERPGERLQNDPRIFDEIDKEAFLVLQMRGQMFPVEIEM
jgi:hypothetical protein